MKKRSTFLVALVLAIACASGASAEVKEADVSGGRTSPSFQARYLLDALQAFDGERVVLSIQPGMRACILRPAEPGEVELTYYLMPMLSR